MGCGCPATEAVLERPVLIVPPPIGRFYFLDLRPGRSFVEYATSRGLQTFLLSWRNPTAGTSRRPGTSRKSISSQAQGRSRALAAWPGATLFAVMESRAARTRLAREACTGPGVRGSRRQ
jgi:hypothetical protein